MSVIELNSPDWIVENLIQEMSRATICRFRPSASLADDTRLPARTKVQFTRDGVKLFAGVTLPAEITIAANGDEVVYTAADVLEYLGNNPCDEINSRYNRSLADSSIADDPTEETIETILDTELGSLVGPGLLIGNIDYSDLPATVRQYIPRDIETTGKTWIGLIDSVLRDIAVVAYWYDPSTVPDGDVIGGTLRLFDISGRNRSPAPVPTNAILPTRGANIAGSPEPNVIDCRITVDVSQTYDKLTFKGWGDLRERREKASPAWSSNPLNNGYFTTSDGFSTDARPLRLNPADPNHARPQFFSTDLSGGSFSDAMPSLVSVPWFPTSRKGDSQWVCRRYQVQYPIVDVKIVREGSGTLADPYLYRRLEQSMFIEMPRYIWRAGPITWQTEDGSALIVGQFAGGTKITSFSNGFVADWGRVVLDPALYPAWLVGSPEEGPLFNIGTPSSVENTIIGNVERGYFLTQEPMVARTTYLWTGQVFRIGQINDLYGNMVAPANNSPVYCYWNIGLHVWLTYTGRQPFEVVVQNPSLGLNKHLVMIDARFFKYTDIDNVVLRDDTASMTAYANELFAMISRERIYGGLTVFATAATINAQWPMGGFVRLCNWSSGPDTWTPTIESGARPAWNLRARIQRRDLTSLARYQESVAIDFDRPITFTQLDTLVRWRTWFAGVDVAGVVQDPDLQRGVIGPFGGGGSSGGGSGGSGSRPPGRTAGGGSFAPIGSSGYSGGPDAPGGTVGVDCCTIDKNEPDPNASGSGI